MTAPTEDILSIFFIHHLRIAFSSESTLNLCLTLTTNTLDIRNNSQLNGLNVPDASLVPVKCTQDVLDLMRIGHRNRAVGATALNERSSRSHR